MSFQCADKLIPILGKFHAIEGVKKLIHLHLVDGVSDVTPSSSSARLPRTVDDSQSLRPNLLALLGLLPSVSIPFTHRKNFS